MSAQISRNFTDNENNVVRTLKKNGDSEVKLSTKIPLKDKNSVPSADGAPKGKNMSSEKHCLEQKQVVDDEQPGLVAEDEEEELYFPQPVPDYYYDIIPYHLALTKRDIRNLVFGYLKPIEKGEDSEDSKSSFDDFEGMPELPPLNLDDEFETCELIDYDLPPLPTVD